jgi:NAD/NADP transhydrogenase alpha subunit
MPAGASQFYARNMSTFVLNFLKDGQMNYDMADEITGRDLDHEGRRGRPGGDEEAAGAQVMSQELLNALAIFVLAILVGFEVISKVPATLHTPLMSGANSIHGIVMVGAMLIAASAGQPAVIRAGLHRDGLRRGQRRGRLRRHRPHAADVPPARNAARQAG